MGDHSSSAIHRKQTRHQTENTENPSLISLLLVTIKVIELFQHVEERAQKSIVDLWNVNVPLPFSHHNLKQNLPFSSNFPFLNSVK